jgi:acetolactate synthase-1/2/3 large subunit
MLETPGPVVVDMQVDQHENCFPMIPGGHAHNQILLGPADEPESDRAEEGMILV